jgi:hypothetical protein
MTKIEKIEKARREIESEISRYQGLLDSVPGYSEEFRFFVSQIDYLRAQLVGMTMVVKILEEK